MKCLSSVVLELSVRAVRVRLFQIFEHSSSALVVHLIGHTPCLNPLCAYVSVILRFSTLIVCLEDWAE